MCLAELKLKLVSTYRTEGKAGVERIIEKYNGSFLKRHNRFKATVEEAIIYCENWLAEIRRRDYDEINGELYS